MKRLLIVVSALLTLVGCGGGGRGSQTSSSYTAAKGAEVASARAAIRAAADAAGGMSASAGREAARTAAIANVGVQEAQITSSGDLVVKYRVGGVEMWLSDAVARYTPPPDRSVQPSAAQALASRGVVRNKHAVILNAIAEDPGFAVQSSRLDETEEALKATGMDVRRINGAAVTPEVLAGLGDDSVIVYEGHGGHWKLASDPSETYNMQTGVEWGTDQNRWKEWADGKEFVAVQVDWGRVNRADNPKVFVGVTGKYWERVYASRHFRDTLFVSGTCSGFYTSEFRDHLKEIGVTAYAGYSDTTDRGYDAANSLIKTMAGGKTLEQAYALLPQEYLHTSVEEGGQTIEAEFRFAGDGSISLPDPDEFVSRLHVANPVNGSTTTQRTATIEGNIDSFRTSWTLAYELNGVLTRLPVADNGTFEANIALQPGDNAITLRLDTNSGREVHILHVQANIASQALWSELRWNTDGNDIDLHLVPDGTAPWSSDDCYYQNRQPSWGGRLDVDDVDGYGPEHITADAIAPGRYLVFVHYYATHGISSSVTLSLALSLGGQTRILNCPQVMTAANNRWNVGYVTFPGGGFELINQFVPNGRGVRALPRKR